MAVLGCGECVKSKAKVPYHEVHGVPGRASLWIEPAYFWTPASAMLVALLEAWLHWRSHYNSLL